MVEVGQAFGVTLTVIGRFKLLRVWLTDGGSDAVYDTPPDGVQASGPVGLGLTAWKVGTWHLWANALDVMGCPAVTGLVRNIQVNP